MTEMQTGDPAAPAADDDVTLEDGQRLLDESARRHLGMSGDEFIAAWDGNGFTNRDSLRVQQVASLLPFAR